MQIVTKFSAMTALAMAICTNATAATYNWSWTEDFFHPGEVVSGTIDLVEGVNDPNNLNIQVTHAMQTQLLGGGWTYQGSFSLPAFEVTNGDVVRADGLFSRTLPIYGPQSMTLNLTESYISSSSSPGGPGIIQSGVITFTPQNISPAVPEPASWALMIGGIGMAGGMMRRQRRVVTKVAFA